MDPEAGHGQHILRPKRNAEPKAEPGFKVCRACGEEKPDIEFSLRYRGAEARRPYCKACGTTMHHDGGSYQDFLDRLPDINCPRCGTTYKARFGCPGCRHLTGIQRDCIDRGAVCQGCEHGGWLESVKCQVKYTDGVRKFFRAHPDARKTEERQ